MTVRASDAGFLARGGEMGMLIRAHDWESTPVGSPEGWPQSLRTTIRLMLTSRHPMFVWWGEELTCFYNDAYSAAIGPDRHPSALERPGRNVWAEIWDVIGPEIELVMSGQGATWHERQLIPITRGHAREDVWWTYGYSPIDDDDAASGVGNVLVICRDVTSEVRAEKAKSDEAGRLLGFFEQAPGFMASLRGPSHLFELANAAYVSLVGRDVLGKAVRDAIPEVEGQGFFEKLDHVYATGVAFTAQRSPITLDSGPNGTSNRRFVDFVYQPIRRELKPDSVGDHDHHVGRWPADLGDRQASDKVRGPAHRVARHRAHHRRLRLSGDGHWPGPRFPADGRRSDPGRRKHAHAHPLLRPLHRLDLHHAAVADLAGHGRDAAWAQA